MKAILYFVAAGIVLPRHQDAAKVINEVTRKRVVFRNADVGHGERAEANEGVAGKVPPNYEGATVYGDDGKVVTGGTAAAPAPTGGGSPQPTERKLNAFGVPDDEGAPTDRESLKKCLDDAGVEYHGNAKTDALIALYVSHFYPEA